MPKWLDAGIGWLAPHVGDPARGFGAAAQGEAIVFGARRPGFPARSVGEPAVARWLSAMRGYGMQRVVCLLSEPQLARYADLLGAYERTFGAQHVLWSPIEDFHLATRGALVDHILPFLAAADGAQQKVVVHCSGGVGRTGHVHAAWLVGFRGMSNAAAIAAVRRQGRNARESRDTTLDALLDACREAFASPPK